MVAICSDFAGGFSWLVDQEPARRRAAQIVLLPSTYCVVNSHTLVLFTQATRKKCDPKSVVSPASCRSAADHAAPLPSISSISSGSVPPAGSKSPTAVQSAVVHATDCRSAEDVCGAVPLTGAF